MFPSVCNLGPFGKSVYTVRCKTHVNAENVRNVSLELHSMNSFSDCGRQLFVCLFVCLFVLFICWFSTLASDVYLHLLILFPSALAS